MNNNDLLLLFDALWKVKTKYIILCLNASAKFQKTSGATHHPALMGNCSTCITCLSPINPVNGVLLVRYR